MKGILRSKRFRANLYRWLFMYVSVMMLFSTAITYSKYVSSLSGLEDSARITKFNVKIGFDGSNCEGSAVSGNTCNSGIYRPSGEIVYSFVVDPSELEVSTDLVLTITSIGPFVITKLDDVTDPNMITHIYNDATGTGKQLLSTPPRTIPPASQDKLRYEVTVRYDISKIQECNAMTEKKGICRDEYGDIRYIFDELNPESVIKVGYSATQTNVTK